MNLFDLLWFIKVACDELQTGSSFGELNSDIMPDSFHMPSRLGPRHCGQSDESNSIENMNRERSAIEARQKSIGMTFMTCDFY